MTNGRRFISSFGGCTGILKLSMVFLAIAAIFAVSAYGFVRISSFVGEYSRVLFPPLVAIVLAKVSEPVFEASRRHLRMLFPRGRPLSALALKIVNGLSTLATIAAVFGPIVLFLVFFGDLAASQCGSIAGKLSSLWKSIRGNPSFSIPLPEGAQAYVGGILENLDFNNILVAGLWDPAGRIVRGIPAILGRVGAFLMVPVYMAVFLYTRPFEIGDVSNVLLGLDERTRSEIRALIDEFQSIVVSFFRGQVLVAFVEGAFFGLAFQFAAGLEYGLLLGMMVGIVGIVPYMGSLLVMPVVCLYAYFGGGGAGALASVVFIWAIEGVVEFFVTALVQSKRTKLGSFAVIFSLFFWGSLLGGVAGLLLGIPLTAFFVVLWNYLKRKLSGKPA